MTEATPSTRCVQAGRRTRTGWTDALQAAQHDSAAAAATGFSSSSSGGGGSGTMMAPTDGILHAPVLPPSPVVKLHATDRPTAHDRPAARPPVLPPAGPPGRGRSAPTSPAAVDEIGSIARRTADRTDGRTSATTAADRPPATASRASLVINAAAAAGSPACCSTSPG